MKAQPASFHISGHAISSATLINASGFLALAFSNLPPMRRFGIVPAIAFGFSMLAEIWWILENDQLFDVRHLQAALHFQISGPQDDALRISSRLRPFAARRRRSCERLPSHSSRVWPVAPRLSR